MSNVTLASPVRMIDYYQAAQRLRNVIGSDTPMEVSHAVRQRYLPSQPLLCDNREASRLAVVHAFVAFREVNPDYVPRNIHQYRFLTAQQVIDILEPLVPLSAPSTVPDGSSSVTKVLDQKPTMRGSSGVMGPLQQKSAFEAGMSSSLPNLKVAGSNGFAPQNSSPLLNAAGQQRSLPSGLNDPSGDTLSDHRSGFLTSQQISRTQAADIMTFLTLMDACRWRQKYTESDLFRRITKMKEELALPSSFWRFVANVSDTLYIDLKSILVQSGATPLDVVDKWIMICRKSSLKPADYYRVVVHLQQDTGRTNGMWNQNEDAVVFSMASNRFWRRLMENVGGETDIFFQRLVSGEDFRALRDEFSRAGDETSHS